MIMALSSVWKKSTRSGANAECVEVKLAGVNAVAVRDSKDPGGAQLAVGDAGWDSFVSAVKSDRF